MANRKPYMFGRKALTYYRNGAGRLRVQVWGHDGYSWFPKGVWVGPEEVLRRRVHRANLDILDDFLLRIGHLTGQAADGFKSLTQATKEATRNVDAFAVAFESARV